MIKKHLTTIFIKKLDERAKLPTQNKDDSGWDLYSVARQYLLPQETTLISTGISFATTPYYKNNPYLPYSINSQIKGRSGLATKSIFPIGGVIDRSYRGDFKICLYNGSKKGYWVEEGDKVAQIVFELVLANTDAHEVCVKEVNWQEKSERGDKGFGSSGR